MMNRLESVLIGICTSINKRVQIGRNAVVVSGAVVTDHVPECAVQRLISFHATSRDSDKIREL